MGLQQLHEEPVGTGAELAMAKLGARIMAAAMAANRVFMVIFLWETDGLSVGIYGAKAVGLKSHIKRERMRAGSMV